MKELLKFITCGSVDDGKSTLIGHMLYDAKLLYLDQEKALELESKMGSCEGKMDYSLLLDGLMAEREQGITIDIAYRYFTTQVRSFIVADGPGHEEYTRNMAVGAAFADLAVILVDATKGVQLQTKRHLRICTLMGIQYFIFAVNKMDLIDYREDSFLEIELELKKIMMEYNSLFTASIPVSATEGDNINIHSDNMLWYKGKTLLGLLENIDIHAEKNNEKSFTMPVQRICRPNHAFRGVQGQIETGKIKIGDEIEILPSRETAKIKTIYYGDRLLQDAQAGQPVTIQLDREVDVSRGCVLAERKEELIGNLFFANILWLDNLPLIQGNKYLLKIGTKSVLTDVMNIKYKIDINTGNKVPAKKIYKNEIAACELSAIEKIVFDEFQKNKTLGEFILIDRITNLTVACGTVKYALRRGENIFRQELEVTRNIRAQMKKQEPCTIWFTGLSGSGKSALANQLEKRLVALNKHTMLLDGDNIRLGLNHDLGFSESDRIENIRRIAEVAKLMNDAGLIVLTAFISPYQRDRLTAREIIGENFIEVFVNTPLEICEKRDVKGLYKKARRNEIPNFTGINSPYEKPDKAEIVVDTSNLGIKEAVDYLMEELKNKLKLI